MTLGYGTLTSRFLAQRHLLKSALAVSERDQIGGLSPKVARIDIAEPTSFVYGKAQFKYRADS